MYWRNRNKVENLWDWLEIAEKGLLPADKQRISKEIEAHFAEALKAHLARGESGQVAEADALMELGDPKVAGRSFRKKHLTEREAKRLVQVQKYSGSFKSLFFTYLSFTFFYFVFVRGSEFRAEPLKSHLFMFLIAFFLCGFILPTISFMIMRGHWFRRKVESVALVMLIGAPVMGLLFGLCTDKTIGTAMLLLGMLETYSWLRIWNKIRKAGADGNGAPRPV